MRIKDADTRSIRNKLKEKRCKRWNKNATDKFKEIPFIGKIEEAHTYTDENLIETVKMLKCEPVNERKVFIYRRY